MAKIRHPKLGRESEVPEASVKHWEKVGWVRVKEPTKSASEKKEQ